MLLRPFLYDPTACASYLFGCGTHSKLVWVPKSRIERFPRRGRLMGRVSGGGGSLSGHGPVVPVLVAAATARACRAAASLGAGEGDRDPASAASAAHAPAPGCPTRADAGWPGVAGSAQPSAATRRVEAVA